MKLLKIIQASYVDDYRINLSFNDGVSSVVDLKDKIYSDHRKVFEKLQNLDFFKRFTLNDWTIEWANGVDLAPEFLHDMAIAQREEACSAN